MSSFLDLSLFLVKSYRHGFPLLNINRIFPVLAQMATTNILTSEDIYSTLSYEILISLLYCYINVTRNCLLGEERVNIQCLDRQFRTELMLKRQVIVLIPETRHS